MFDFRLKVFNTVAKRLNFTKAAEELFISQPAVTKHIHEIEGHYKIQLFERRGSKITLSEAGKILLTYTERIFDIYRDMEFEINSFTQHHDGILRVGASTTVAQYILPPILAAFHNKYKDIKISLTTGNTERIESDLDNGTIDLGIIEGKSKNTAFKYTHFIDDEIVLVASTSHPKAQKKSLTLEELTEIPLLLREPGSGTLEYIAYELKKAGMRLSDLSVEMQMNSPESIKAYLPNSKCMAFLSVHAILKELRYKDFSIIDVKELDIKRIFQIIHPHGGISGLAELFMKYAITYNFR